MLKNNQTYNKTIDNFISETDYKLMISKNTGIISCTDRIGNITYVSPSFLSLTKYRENELLGQNHRLLKSNKHKDEFYEELWNKIANGQKWKGTIINRAKDGRLFKLVTEITPILDDAMKIIGYYSERQIDSRHYEQ